MDIEEFVKFTRVFNLKDYGNMTVDEMNKFIAIYKNTKTRINGVLNQSITNIEKRRKFLNDELQLCRDMLKSKIREIGDLKVAERKLIKGNKKAKKDIKLICCNDANGCTICKRYIISNVPIKAIAEPLISDPLPMENMEQDNIVINEEIVRNDIVMPNDDVVITTDIVPFENSDTNTYVPLDNINYYI